jgi:integrase
MAHRTAPDETQKANVLAVAARESRRDAALIALGFAVGLRSFELRSIAVGQVHDGTKIRPTLRIERASLKGGRGVRRAAVRSRVIPINAEAAGHLGSYLEERTRHAPLDLRAPLFLSREGGGAISCRQIRRIIHRVFRNAGLGDCGNWGAHSLRRHFARRVYERSGHDIVLTRQALGHAHCSTTEAYLAVTDDDVAALIQHLGADQKSTVVA